MRRSLLLSGFMATGKSTVGRRVAARAGLPFVDLDERISQRAGKSVAQIFEQDGEAHFRALERAELERVLAAPQPEVVALGGGALLKRDLRLKALDKAVVVTLAADIPTLLGRTAHDSSRPLLRGKSPDEVEQLLAARQVAYAEAHEQVDTAGGDPSAIAERVLEIWRRDPIAVAAGVHSYSVEVGNDFAPARLNDVVGSATTIVLVSDETVNALYGANYLAALSAGTRKASSCVLAPGEEHKNVGSLERIWNHCLEHGADRKSVLVGVGGGVVTDVTGFAAATWMRGVPWVSVPTTLLGMVDASVGGKTAVDLPKAKNCVGAFWQPKRVLCDTRQLVSETPRGTTSALAEIVKTALIGDPAMFTLLQERAADVVARDWDLIRELVYRSIAVKARVVSEDERETGFRAALNLGHTVGHALEACDGFGGLTHGEAVSLGLVAALRLGKQRGATPQELVHATTRLLAQLGLPVDLDKRPLARAAALLGHDKKRGGSSIRFVFTSAPGSIQFQNIPLAELQTQVSGLG
ncbi:MAG TPA: 3-dehydroquinate synthase [Polyangiaceae bacterium]|nr:3-dehydroquinate synthase [Polyangiaceae bacterium]